MDPLYEYRLVVEQYEIYKTGRLASSGSYRPNAQGKMSLSSSDIMPHSIAPTPEYAMRLIHTDYLPIS